MSEAFIQKWKVHPMTHQILSRRRFIAAASTFTSAVWLGASDALAAGWELLGSRSVRLIGDVDVITVAASKGKFKAVQLRVKENGIFMNDMQITFRNGDKTDVPLRFHIARGESTRKIDLPGRARFIRSVRLFYRSVPNSDGRAKVALWGFK